MSRALLPQCAHSHSSLHPQPCPTTCTAGRHNHTMRHVITCQVRSVATVSVLPRFQVCSNDLVPRAPRPVVTSGTGPGNHSVSTCSQLDMHTPLSLAFCRRFSIYVDTYLLLEMHDAAKYPDSKAHLPSCSPVPYRGQLMSAAAMPPSSSARMYAGTAPQ